MFLIHASSLRLRRPLNEGLGGKVARISLGPEFCLDILVANLQSRRVSTDDFLDLLPTFEENESGHLDIIKISGQVESYETNELTARIPTSCATSGTASTSTL